MTQNKTDNKPAEPVAVPARTPPPPVILQESARVKVLRGRKKKKRRYSAGLGTIQHLERGVTESLETVTKGVARVFSEYSERSDKSARKKRDGALRDGIENWTKALSKGMRIAGDAPYDFVKEITRGPGSKQVRDTVRLLTPPPLR
ncbi:MAG: hypothetical protein ABSF72_18970 [Candidatus Sulfotelmatobacter sp.]|jgi:hypothetical protein